MDAFPSSPLCTADVPAAPTREICAVLIIADPLLRCAVAALLERDTPLRVRAASADLLAARRLPSRHAVVDVVVWDAAGRDRSSVATVVGHLKTWFAGAEVLTLRAAASCASEFVAQARALCLRPTQGGSSCETTLTPHEVDVLLGVALGRKTQQIAAEMRRSPKTIEKHRASVQRKLGLNTVAQFTSHAISHGLLSTDQVLAHDGSRSNAAPVRRLALLSAQQTCNGRVAA